MNFQKHLTKLKMKHATGVDHINCHYKVPLILWDTAHKFWLFESDESIIAFKNKFLWNNIHYNKFQTTHC